MVTLIQLEYIIAVDTYRHFATAAEHCFVTQPTLSMQIKKLEDHLGVSIFDRSKQPVIPTDVGNSIIEQARLILRESEKIDDIIKTYKGEVKGELKIGIIPTLAPYLLPLFIGKTARAYPDITLHVREMVTEEITESLKKDLIDVGILVTPLKEKSIVETPLFYEEIKVYANSNHEFAIKDSINIQEIATPELWLLSDGHCFRNQVVNLCSYHNNFQTHNLPFKYESGSLETLKKMVNIEGGFTLLPELAINEMTEKEKRQILDFNREKPLREISLVYVRNYAKKKLLDVLISSIKESVPHNMLEPKRGSIVEWRS